MQPIELRPMTTKDIDPVMSLEIKLYEYPWTKGIFADCIRVGYDCWVSIENDHIIGYGVLSVGAGESHILNLAVEKTSQSQGIGKHILIHLMDRARLRSAEMCLLEVRPSNKTAIHLYETIGFNEIGSRKDYYPTSKGKEDALLFACQL